MEVQGEAGLREKKHRHNGLHKPGGVRRRDLTHDALENESDLHLS